jgi:hypothetical protein
MKKPIYGIYCGSLWLKIGIFGQRSKFLKFNLRTGLLCSDIGTVDKDRKCASVTMWHILNNASLNLFRVGGFIMYCCSEISTCYRINVSTACYYTIVNYLLLT